MEKQLRFTVEPGSDRRMAWCPPVGSQFQQRLRLFDIWPQRVIGKGYAHAVSWRSEIVASVKQPVATYATQREVEGKMQNIQVARSRDLAVRKWVGDALPSKPAWASQTHDFWAPHVSYHQGRHYLYYSAKPDIALVDKKSGLCLTVATAKRPDAPFTDIGKPLQCGDGFINIDPMSHDDPASGKRLLYWRSKLGPTKVQQLANDRVSFATGSKPVDLVDIIKNEEPQNYQRLVEEA